MQFIEMVLNFFENLDYIEILKKAGQALGVKLLGVVFKPVGAKILKRFKKPKPEISKKKQSRTTKKSRKNKGTILKVKIRTRKVCLRIEIKK